MTRTDPKCRVDSGRHPDIRSSLIWGAVALLVPGCSRPGPTLVPAAGTLTVAGRPIGDISLQFLPEDVEGQVRPTSFAITDAEGKFQLRTYEGREGAVEGMHTVLVVDTLEERPAQGEAAGKPPRVDPKHSTMAGGIRCRVVADGAPLALELP